MGYAQPDAFVLLENKVLLLEAKLTQSDQAEAQCTKLYVPLLERIYGRPVVSAQVFKNIRYETPTMVESLEELTQREGHWQWHNPMI